MVRLDGADLVLDFQHYDSVIRAIVASHGTRLDGDWKLRRAADQWVTLSFHAEAGAAPRFPAAAENKVARSVTGRWLAKFSKTEEPAVGVFESAADGVVTGTFLTPGGDYRYLAGTLEGDHLRLSAFDGRHAFLFDARLAASGELSGDFWSGDTWHETWTARPDPNAELPDGMVRLNTDKRADLSKLTFKNAEGKEQTLADTTGGGKVVVVEIFGSWCPNCHDAGEYLADVDRRYREKGVRVVGLAFEATGDFAHDAEQVRRFGRRHNIAYPLLVGGQRGKDDAAAVAPLIDKIQAYPTTIFIDSGGRVRAIHTGFSGPATGRDYDRQKKEFESLIDELLAS